MLLFPPFRGSWWEKAGWLFMIYALTVPVIVGIGSGHNAGLVIRDVIPFLFIMLPLLVLKALPSDLSGKITLTIAVAAAGLIFSLRFIVPSFVEHGRIGFSALPDEDPLYLANAPTVLFAAILGVGYFGLMLSRPLSLKTLIFSGAAALSTVPCFFAMIASNQRATIGLAVMCVACLWLLNFFRNPRGGCMSLLIVAFMLILFAEPFGHILDNLFQKTAQVGFNNRVQEASLVFEMVNKNPLSVLFGFGWGQTIASPAVGGVTVNYTHTMITAFWLKTGLAGVMLGLFYFGGLVAKLWSVLWKKPIVALALAAPCLIDLTLYASYKSLDFGLILMLIPLWANAPQEVARQAAVVYSRDSSMTV